jgi:uncharacterized protein YegP (UPF0339 family)
MAAKFVLKKTAKGNFVFNLKAPNGLVILTSEAYKDKGSAMNGIESVRKNAGKDSNFERLIAKNGQAYFVLKAVNKEVVGQSEMYSSPSSVKKGIASVMANARTARLEDLTVKK